MIKRKNSSIGKLQLEETGNSTENILFVGMRLDNWCKYTYTPPQKRQKNMNRQASQKEIQYKWLVKYERWSLSPLIRNMQVKITKKYHFPTYYINLKEFFLNTNRGISLTEEPIGQIWDNFSIKRTMTVIDWKTLTIQETMSP